MIWQSLDFGVGSALGAEPTAPADVVAATGTAGEERHDSTARGVGADATPTVHHGDSGLRRFLRGGLRSGSVGPLMWGLGRRPEAAITPVGQVGLRSGVVTAEHTPPSEQRAPELPRPEAGESRAWWAQWTGAYGA